MRLTTRKLVYYAISAALTALCSQIAIPLPWDVPLNLATFSVMLAGALLGPWGGFCSQGVYLLLGAVGAPVFAMFRGGLDRLVGPTGGYLIGYLFMALVIGLIVSRAGNRLPILILAMIAGTAICYLFGTVWYMLLTKSSLLPALSLCVLPYLPGDAAKILLAALLSLRLKKIVSFSR